MNRIFEGICGLLILVMFTGCGGGGGSSSQTTYYQPNAVTYQSESVIMSSTFADSTQGWTLFYTGAGEVSQSGVLSNKTPGALNVFNRANTYDGAYKDISAFLKKETTYVIRGYLKRGGTHTDTYALNVKIGTATYKSLNRVLVDDDNWTKFRAFVRFTQAEIDSGIKLYVNSNSFKDDYYLDDVEIVSSNYQPSQTDNNDALRTSGPLIKNAAGETVRLRGINLIAYSDEDAATDDTTAAAFMNYSYYNYDKDDLIALKKMGFNSVRIALWYRTFEDESAPYVYKESGFEWLNFMIGWAKEAGLYIVLDMHAPQGGGFQGPRNVTAFWGSSLYQDRYKKMWKEIAGRYRNEPVIAAYDLINEPCATTQAQYLALLSDTIDTIKTVDTHHIINVENGFSSDASPFLLSGYSNILYDFHFYDPWNSFTDNNTSVYGVDVTKTQVQGYFNTYADFYAGYPFHVSEFGQQYGTFTAKNSIGWVNDVIDMLDAKGASYHYFSFKGNEFGLYTSKNSFALNSPKNEPLITLLSNKTAK
ncbi:MAG: cellulase family glycosylhydrolase [Sulfuricurvum sp.]|nr:cellulase family glycosylhydrolase [Sulfuricurvum sp.]